jgi:sporulation protein YlmC with PRC-barrel domain
MDIKKFDASPGALVIVEQKKENQFFLNSPGPWTAVAAIGSYVILQKPLN